MTETQYIVLTKPEVSELREKNISLCNLFLCILSKLGDYDDMPEIKTIGTIFDHIYVPLLVDHTEDSLLRIPKVESTLYHRLKNGVKSWTEKYTSYMGATFVDVTEEEVLKDIKEWVNCVEGFNWAWMARLYNPDKTSF